MSNDIIIVSGLPRSGTSLMMQMIHAAGVEAITDEIREADEDNPLGYFEFEQVKQIREDKSWIVSTRDKCFKMVSMLLYDLPATEKYKVLFMRRNLDEILASQRKMLEHKGTPADVAREAELRRIYTKHLADIIDWIRLQSFIDLLEVNYNEMLATPVPVLSAVADFLERRVDPDIMAQVIDPKLYRQRRG